MNRAAFMQQLENLLQNISVAERQEALQYYNDYFDDAGVENEEEVIDSDELVSRHKYVSEEIKKVTKEIEETYKELNISNDLFR